MLQLKGKFFGTRKLNYFLKSNLLVSIINIILQNSQYQEPDWHKINCRETHFTLSLNWNSQALCPFSLQD